MIDIVAGMTGTQYLNAINNIEKVYNVEDYGAVHDGLTDDTEAIQDAINACAAAHGGTVYFPNGVYLLGGAEQTDIGGINYQSQLYIPARVWSSTDRFTIRLYGQSVPNDTMNNQFAGTQNLLTGVVWKSTITGSDMFSSVIASKGEAGAFGSINYNNTIIENITIYVNHHVSNGATLSGINMVNSSMTHIRNCHVSTQVHYQSTVVPSVHHFGVAIGKTDSNLFQYIDNVSCWNMYYGHVIGEGVVCKDLVSSGCYIGLMVLKSFHPSYVYASALHWCKYAIASQQEDFGGFTPASGQLLIHNVSIETKAGGAEWYAYEDIILDTNNYLFGEMHHHYIVSGNATPLYITKANWGLNLLVKNITKASNFYWTTATRPIAPGYGCTGWNVTTSKLECFNGSTWSDLF